MGRKLRSLARIALSTVVWWVAGCADDAAPSYDPEWGIEEALAPTPPPGKEDSEFRRGLRVATDTRRTQVWTAKNAWDDTATPAARAAGLAWGADSGLTWDQKYAAWLDGLAWIPAADGYSTTIRLTTPWGKTLDSPSLECAETVAVLAHHVRRLVRAAAVLRDRRRQRRSACTSGTTACAPRPGATRDPRVRDPLRRSQRPGAGAVPGGVAERRQPADQEGLRRRGRPAGPGRRAASARTSTSST
jgi:hypothetical protein